ncbi:MAG: acyl carrier protein phosphodiesterase, partial [Sediminibacterium sp.]
QHPATKKAKEYFKPAVGAYAGAFMDVVYDHFLALDNLQFTGMGLPAFAAEVYTQLTEHESLLPEKFAQMLPYMSSQNWLYNYRFTEGIEKSFGGVVKRAQYLTDATPVFKLFLTHYKPLQESYNEFFPDIKKFASSQFALLIM